VNADFFFVAGQGLMVDAVGSPRPNGRDARFRACTSEKRLDAGRCWWIRSIFFAHLVTPG